MTAFGAVAAALRRPQGHAVERTAVLRFDHPYAAVATAGRPTQAGRGTSSGSPSPESSFAGLLLFAAWVHQPVEPEDNPPGS